MPPPRRAAYPNDVIASVSDSAARVLNTIVTFQCLWKDGLNQFFSFEGNIWHHEWKQISRTPPSLRLVLLDRTPAK